MVIDWVPGIRQLRAARFLEAEANENHAASLLFSSLPLSQLFAVYIRCGKPNLAYEPQGFSLQPFLSRQTPAEPGQASAQVSN